MTALARANGWRGFDGIGEKVDHIPGDHESKAGWLYDCDGMPSMMGCGSRVVIPRRWSKVGLKKASGWLVCYGECFPDEVADDDQGNDLDVVLTFCPKCAAVVAEQAIMDGQPEPSTSVDEVL